MINLSKQQKTIKISGYFLRKPGLHTILKDDRMYVQYKDCVRLRYGMTFPLERILHVIYKNKNNM